MESENGNAEKSTTSKIIGTIMSVSATAVCSADFMYGTAGATHSVAEAIGRPLATLGFENSIFSTLPYISIGFAGLDILFHLRSGIARWMRNGSLDWLHIANALAIAADCNLIAVAYANKTQLMSIGSTAFGLVCDAFALKALADFLMMLPLYWIARKKIQDAYSNCSFSQAYDRVSKETKDRFDQIERCVYLSTMNLIGWGALALAHLPALAAAAPALITLGSVFLIGEGLYYAGYRLCQRVPRSDQEISEPMAEKRGYSRT